MLAVEQWAEIRRLALVEKLSQREIRRRTGAGRDTIRKAVAAAEPPSYSPRRSRPSKLDPYRAEIERLLDDEPTLSAHSASPLRAPLRGRVYLIWGGPVFDRWQWTSFRPCLTAVGRSEAPAVKAG